MTDVADDSLSALVHRDVFHPDGLLASASVSLESLDLSREGSRELIEGTLRTVLLRNIVHMSEAPCEGHGGVVDGGHLRREHLRWTWLTKPFFAMNSALAADL